MKLSDFNISRFINIPIFAISLLLGILYFHFTNPDYKKIYVYPNPENVDIIQYKDKANNCFQFKQHDTSCPSDKSIFKIPIQT
jgi:hypothetical protein